MTDVVVFDPAPETGAFLERRLGEAGYAVVLVDDLEGAVEAARRGRPSMIVTHADAPEGLMLCQEVKGDASLADALLVVVDSGAPGAGLLRHWLAGGPRGDLYVRRPLGNAWFGDRLEHWLSMQADTVRAEPQLLAGERPSQAEIEAVEEREFALTKRELVLEQKESALVERASQVEARVADLQRAREEAEAARVKAEAARDAGAARMELEAARVDLETAKAEATDARTAAAEARAEAEAVRADAEAREVELQAELREVRAALASAQHELGGTQAEVEDLKGELASVQAEAAEGQDALAAAAEELEALHEELSALQDQVTSATAAEEAAREELTSTKDRISAISGERDDVLEALTAAKQERNDARAELAGIRDGLRAHAEAVSSALAAQQDVAQTARRQWGDLAGRVGRAVQTLLQTTQKFPQTADGLLPLLGELEAVLAEGADVVRSQQEPLAATQEAADALGAALGDAPE